MQTINLSNDTSYEAHAVIWEDLSSESRRPMFRAFWAREDESGGCPVVGYCSSGGSWPLIRQVVAEFRRLHPGEPIYRNGRLLK